MGAIVIVHVPETFAGACGMALTATTESSSAHAQNAASHTVVFFIFGVSSVFNSCMKLEPNAQPLARAGPAPGWVPT